MNNDTLESESVENNLISEETNLKKEKPWMKKWKKILIILILLCLVNWLIRYYNEKWITYNDTKEIANLITSSWWFEYIDNDLNFNTWVYEKINSIKTNSIESMKVKNITIKSLEIEEDFSKKINSLGDVWLEISDYWNSKKVKEIIDKTKTAKIYYIEYKNKIHSLYKEYTGIEPNIINPIPYSGDEKIKKIEELVMVNIEKCDKSIEFYNYILQVNNKFEYDEEWDLIISDDSVREKINRYIDLQEKLDSKINDWYDSLVRYQKEYLNYYNKLYNK